MDRSAYTIPCLAAVVIAGFIASERLTAPPPPDGKIHVKYWEKWTDFEFDAMKKVVDSFNASQDRIHVDVLSITNIEDKTLMATSGKVPPDVVGLYGENVTQYADDHAVMQLDDMCNAAGIKKEQYIEPFWNACVVRGKLYALPSTPATTALHYNRKLFREAGLDPDKPPRTIEELNEDSDKLTKFNSDGHLLQSGFMPAEPGWWNWAWGPFFGGKLWDGKDKITINSPENVAGFTWVQRFAKKYGSDAMQSFKSGFGNFSSPQNGFMTGQDAMEIQGVWMYNFIHKFQPDLDWAAAPFPAASPSLPDPTVVDLDVLCIPTGAKHPKEAFEFLRYVESQKGLEMLCLGQKKITPLKAVSPGFIENHPNPFIKLFIRLAYSKTAVSTPKVGVWAEYKNEISSAFDDINLLHKTPKEALDYVQQRMQPVLDKHLERLRMRGDL